MVTKESNEKWPEHVGPCKTMKMLFGLLVLLVGLYGIAGDMGMLKVAASPWNILIVLVGLMCLLKASAGNKCPACRMK